MRQFVVLVTVCIAATAFALPAGDLQTAQQQRAPQGAPAPPSISWGRCAQLQPSENERQAKAKVIEGCLSSVPFPQSQNITQDEVNKHREEVTTCALKNEGWFETNGYYKFYRARNEIVNKKLPQDIEQQILAKHDECNKEATDKYPSSPVNQVQMYQACMDYHISEICGIEVKQAGGPPQQFHRQ